MNRRDTSQGPESLLPSRCASGALTVPASFFCRGQKTWRFSAAKRQSGQVSVSTASIRIVRSWRRGFGNSRSIKARYELRIQSVAGILR